MTWLTDILNSILTFFDRIVYGLISTLYELLIYLANLDLFGMSTITSSTTPNENIIVNFSSRIYALLGIFMLFKISFSILQYMVNPDDFSDKGKGFGKLVTNVLVSLVLIITVPYIFQKAYQIQGIILEDNTLGKLILGQSNSENVAEGSTNAEMAEDLQFLVYGTFFSVNMEALPSCESGPVLGTKAMAQNRDCLDDLAELLPDGANKLGDFFTADNPDRRFDAFGEVVNTKNGDNQYVFNYMPVISTIAGGFIVVMLLSFCFDVAVRIIKLGFLEIIAPIPIISYMDPKQSSKDGMLGKWGKECLSTYLSLFIRIAIIYFAFFVIDLVANQLLASPSDQIYLNNQAPEGLMAVFVKVMVILGVLLFAKEVPKLLENLIPGMSGSGNFNINPIKKIKESPLAAGAIGATAVAGGVALGAAGNTIANIAKNKDLKQKLQDGKITQKEFDAQYRGKGNIIRSAIGGAASAGARSMVIGAKTGNPFAGVVRGVKASSDARRSRAAGYGGRQKVEDQFNEMIGLESDTGTTDRVKSEIKTLRQRLQNAQRDEASASYQMQNLMTRNPNVSQSMREAFTENDEGNLVYNDYNDYVKNGVIKKFSKTPDEEKIYSQLYDEVEKRMQVKIQNQQDITAELKEIDALVNQIDPAGPNGKSILSRQDYDNYKGAREARNEADNRSKKIEKEISNLEETQGFKGHLKDNKK